MIAQEHESHLNATALLQVAQALSKETVASDVQRVGVEAAMRLLDAARAGWVAIGGDGAQVTMVVPDGSNDDEAVLALAVEAAKSRRVLVSKDVVCLPVAEADTVEGVVFAVLPHTPDSFAHTATLETLAELIAAGLRTATLFNSLEAMVATEMTRVVEREASMQLVLDSMAEGLVVCDVAGMVGPIRSKSVTTWFGEPGEGMSLADYLGDEKQKFWIDIGFEGMRDAFLPFEVIAEQMPKKIQRESRTYRVAFRPVAQGDVISEVVVTLLDITEALAQELTDRINREVPTIVGMLLRDRDQFRDFVGEIGQLFESLTASTSLTEQQRMLHTLKGNAMVFGFGRFAEACHALEDRIADDPAAMNAAAVEVLSTEWAQSFSRVSMFLDTDDNAPRISAAEYGMLLEYLNGQRSHDEIARLVATWSQRPIGPALQSHATAAQRAAEKLGKELTVVVDDGGLRLPRADLRGFCATLVHVVRNAVDHGLELPSERLAGRKSSSGEIRLSARMRDDNLVFIVQDDGRGIDWARLRLKAKSAGLPAETERDLIDALFADGVSTRDEVTTLSGRGVGLSATKKACEDLGGSFSVHTEPGRGTTFEFSFPLGDTAVA
jgi:sensor histidine kinase regulating citrate/malate metabolism